MALGGGIVPNFSHYLPKAPVANGQRKDNEQ